MRCSDLIQIVKQNGFTTMHGWQMFVVLVTSRCFVAICNWFIQNEGPHAYSWWWSFSKVMADYIVRTHHFFWHRGWGVQLTQSPLKADKSFLLVVGAEDLPSIRHNGDPWSVWTYRWPNTTPYIESSPDVSFMTLRVSSFCLTHQYGFGLLLHTWLAGALCFSLSSWLYHMFQGGGAIRWDAFVVTFL